MMFSVCPVVGPYSVQISCDVSATNVFMIQDFATRSLKIAEETPGLNLNEVSS